MISRSLATVHVHRTPEAFRDLREPWSRLLALQPRAAPFQSPQWLEAWWQYLGGGELLVLCAEHRREQVGILPMCVFDNPQTHRREAQFLGVGVSDEHDVLALPGLEGLAAASLACALDESAWQWDAVVLQQVPADSPLLSALRDVAVRRLMKMTVQEQEPCYAVALPSPGTALQHWLPSAQWQWVRKARSRATKIKDLEVQRIKGEASRQALASLFDLHGARWALRGQDGVLASPVVRDFHLRVCQDLEASGHLAMWAASVGDRCISVYYGFEFGRRAFAYLTGFSPAMAGISPGTLLVSHAIEAAVEQGLGAFDFLRGNEAHKLRWGAKPQSRLRVELERGR